MRRPIAIAAALLLACAAHAEEEIHQGGEIQVRDERLRPVEVFQDTAIETEWVTEEEIEAIPATDAAEVLQNLSGVRTSQRIQGQQAVVSIEGMPPEYTQLLVDGERWSGEIGGVGDATDIPLQNVKRIELLRGNQGARHGSDAAGGVVNVVTHGPPSEGWELRLGGAGGTHPRHLGAGTGALRLGPLGLSLSGEYDRTRGFDPPSDPDITLSQIGGEDSVNRQVHLYGRWDAPLGDAVTLRGNGLYRVEDDDFVSEQGEDIGSHTDTNGRGNVGIDWLARESTQLSADFSYYAIETDSDVARSFELFEDEYGADLVLDHFLVTGSLQHALVAGVESLVQRLRLDEAPLPESIDNDELAATRHRSERFVIPSVYLQTESTLTDRLSLVLGARARFHSEFDARVLPQAALLWRPHRTLKLRASWGRGYRTPSLRDLHQPPTPQLGGAYFLAGNPDLEPEASTSLRGGFEWSPARWLSLASTAFHNDIDDHIRSQLSGTIRTGFDLVEFFPSDDPAYGVICPAQLLNPPLTFDCEAFLAGEPIDRLVPRNANIFRRTNLDTVRTWGIEARLRLRPSRWAAFAVDYTWLRTRVVDSNIDAEELPNEPEHAVTVRGALAAPRLGTRLGAAVRFRSGVIPERSGTGLLSFADSSSRTDPSYAIDLRVAQPLPFGLELWADATNLTDERREDSYAVRGRTLLVGISGRFEGRWL